MCMVKEVEREVDRGVDIGLEQLRKCRLIDINWLSGEGVTCEDTE